MCVSKIETRNSSLYSRKLRGIEFRVETVNLPLSGTVYYEAVSKLMFHVRNQSAPINILGRLSHVLVSKFGTSFQMNLKHYQKIPLIKNRSVMRTCVAYESIFNM